MTQFYHADLWGSREDKYRYLDEHDVTTVEWEEIFPQSPFYLFVPQDTDLLDEYSTGWKITDIMPVNSAGIVTSRDSLTIQWSFQKIKEVVKDFVSLSVEDARSKYQLGKDAQDWKVSLALEDLCSNEFDFSKIVPIFYRPFDSRYTYYTGQSRGFMCRPRSQVMNHILSGQNLGLIFMRQVALQDDYSHFGVTQEIVDNRAFYSNKGIMSLAPLYIYPDTTNEQGNLLVDKSPNFSSDFLQSIREKLGYTPTPEAIFYYIYAIFHSPTYRQRYAEFLKIDFPRVPLTRNDELFQILSAKGQELVELHLMKSKKLNKPIAKFAGDGDSTVTTVKYKPEKQQVYINKTRYFSGIPPEVWEFKVGGYQVLDKWLKDRKKAKRTLSFDDVLHYQKIVVALKETIQLMAEIDAAIPGFPIE